jgi:hypothetical protein
MFNDLNTRELKKWNSRLHFWYPCKMHAKLFTNIHHFLQQNSLALFKKYYICVIVEYKSDNNMELFVTVQREKPCVFSWYRSCSRTNISSSSVEWSSFILNTSFLSCELSEIFFYISLNSNWSFISSSHSPHTRRRGLFNLNI